MTKTIPLPMRDRVIVRRKEAQEQTEGGIYFAEAAKEAPAEGTVIAVGPGRLLEDGRSQTMAVEKGDVVMFGKYAGTEITVDGETLLVLREDEIMVRLQTVQTTEVGRDGGEEGQQS